LHFKVGVVIQEDGTAETVVKAALIQDGTAPLGFFQGRLLLFRGSVT